MDIKIICKTEKYEEYKEMLIKGGFIINENGILTLYENDYYKEYIIGKGKDEYEVFAVSDINYIDVTGGEVYIHTNLKVAKASNKMYELEANLPISTFVRISKFTIVNKNFIKKIVPTIGMKFYLTMLDQKIVDVTRSYYYKFKEYMDF